MIRSSCPRVLFAASVLLAGLFLIAGCGSDRTTGPAGPQPASNVPTFVAVPGGNPMVATLGKDDSGSSVDPGLDPQELAGSGPAVLAIRAAAGQRIDGAVGGTLSCGRFTLTIPPGAYKGVQNIRIFDTSFPVAQCRLLPEGLQFDVPVTLTVNLQLTTGDRAGMTIFWYDPDQADNPWVDMNGSYDRTDHTVSAQLHHFSCYSPGFYGRGGW